MNTVLDLAKKYKISGKPEDIERMVHRAQALALRQSSDELEKTHGISETLVIAQLRRMATDLEK